MKIVLIKTRSAVKAQLKLNFTSTCQLIQMRKHIWNILQFKILRKIRNEKCVFRMAFILIELIAFHSVRPSNQPSIFSRKREKIGFWKFELVHKLNRIALNVISLWAYGCCLNEFTTSVFIDHKFWWLQLQWMVKFCRIEINPLSAP